MRKKKVAQKKAKRSSRPKRVVRKARRPAKKIKKTAHRRPAKRSGSSNVPARGGSASGGEPRTPNAKPIGVVTHFYNHIKVAIVKFKKPVRVGTNVRFRGATTDFTQALQSLQYDHKPIALAPRAKQIGVKVLKRVREGDGVFVEK